MKAIICEMCNSQDLVKQDGMYVCQNCGTRYAPEEAKKLMIDVKVDNSDKLKNWYILARRARDSDDAQNAAKYYDLILQEDPQSWEATFYRGYFQAMQTKIYYISATANSFLSLIKTVLPMVGTIESDAERRAATLEICYRTATLANILESNARQTFKSSVDSTSSGQMEYYDQYTERAAAVAELCGGTAGGALAMFPDDSDIQKTYTVLMNMALQYIINYCNNDDVIRSMEAGNEVRTIRKWQPSYQLPKPNREGFPSFYITVLNKYDRKYSTINRPVSNSSGGCYVATAVYGSYDCPHVWTLRRYRDYTLAETWYGRAFIRTYYAISPTIVKWFGKTQWFRNMWKTKLDKMVERLNEKGVANTPYQDRQW